MQNSRKIGIILLNLGGPDSLEAVRPFLYNLFVDPEIINFPLSFLFRRRLAKIISDKRSPRIQEQYKQIGGKSPINELTRNQAEALEKALNGSIDCKVYIAMRYWKPFTEEIMEQIERDGINEVILLPLYPQFSVATTGSSIKEWKRLAEKYPYVKNLKTNVVERYYDYIPYIDSVVTRINETLERFPESVRDKVHMLFSAHGTPVKLVKQGDPYQQEIIRTVVAVTQRGKYKQTHHLSYQSKVGPQKWLEPKTPVIIEQLAGEGVKYMLVVPIAFVSDHLETLFEIGIEFRRLAKEKGVEQFEVIEGLNDSPKFISALKELVLDRIN